MTKHACDALVITCIDFRFRKYIRKWNEKHFSESGYDMVALAGSTYDLPTVIKQVEISSRLHRIKRIFIIHHEDCGAYGKQGTKKIHKKELRKAQKIINTLYPKLSIKLYYLHLNGKFEPVT